MNDKLINQLLDAMDIMTDGKINQLNQDTMIEATVRGKRDNSNIYEIEYAGSRFTAVSNADYTIGDRVYVMRASAGNTIIGHAQYQASQINILEEEKDKEYIKLSANAVATNDSSFEVKNGNLLVKDNTDNKNPNPIVIEKSYLEGAGALQIEADFTVEADQNSDDIDYRITFTVLDTTDKEQTFTFDINDMIGNPFNLANSHQKKRINFDYLLKEITKIELYQSGCNSFSIKNLSIYSSSDEEIADGLYISHDGFNITNFDVSTIPTGTELLASLYLGGRRMIENVTFSWKRQMVDSDHKIVPTEIHNTDTLGLTGILFPLNTEVITCVANFENKNYETTITISNLNVTVAKIIENRTGNQLNFTVDIDENIGIDAKKLGYYWYNKKDNSPLIDQDDDGNNATLSIDIQTIEVGCIVSYKQEAMGADILVGNPGYSVGIPKEVLVSGNFKMNGVSTFTYSEAGQLLTARNPVYFYYYDTDGQWHKLSPEEINYVPTIDSPLVNWIPTDKDEDGKIINDGYYRISAPDAWRKDIRENKNITIAYNGETAIFTLDFLRQGMAGTNGTKYRVEICKKIGDAIQDYEEYIQLSLGDSANITARLIRIEDGVEIDLASAITTLSIWGSWKRDENNNIVTGEALNSDLIVDQTTITVKDAFIEDGKVCNIIRAEIDFEGKKYYGFLPIVIYADENYKLNQGFGFTNVLYSSAGKNPSYRDQEFNTKTEVEFTSNADDITVNNKDKKFTPKIEIGSVNKCITVDGKVDKEVEGETVKDIKIRIPFLFTLNTYENAFINGWDGSSVEVSEDGSIAAVIAGFGKKEEDNSFTGVVLSEEGLVAKNKGKQTLHINAKDGSIISPKFQITSEGEASFGGSLSAADGTFVGNINIIRDNTQVQITSDPNNDKIFDIKSYGNSLFYISNLGDSFFSGSINTKDANIGPLKVNETEINLFEIITVNENIRFSSSLPMDSYQCGIYYQNGKCGYSYCEKDSQLIPPFENALPYYSPTFLGRMLSSNLLVGNGTEKIIKLSSPFYSADPGSDTLTIGIFSKATNYNKGQYGICDAYSSAIIDYINQDNPLTIIHRFEMNKEYFVCLWTNSTLNTPYAANMSIEMRDPAIRITKDGLGGKITPYIVSSNSNLKQLYIDEQGRICVTQ